MDNAKRKYIQYSNGKNYFFHVNNDDKMEVTSYNGAWSSTLDTFDKTICLTILVYEDFIWCLKKDGYVYRKNQGRWVLEMNRQCSDFKITNDYVVCGNSSIFVQWRVINGKPSLFFFLLIYIYIEVNKKANVWCAAGTFSTLQPSGFVVLH